LRRRSFLALTTAAAVGALMPSRIAAAATGDAEIVVTAAGGVYRAVRSGNGTYSAYQQMNFGPKVGRLSAVTIDGQEFVEFDELVGPDGEHQENKHAIRQPDGSYAITDSTFTDSEPAAVGSVSGELHLVGVNPLTHAIRHADGTWSPEGYVEGETGPVGQQYDAAIAGDGAILHVVVASVNGIRHTIRHPDGAWDHFGDVESQAGALVGVSGGCAVAVVNGELHVVVVTDPLKGETSSIHHTIRHANGTWDPWGELVGGAVGAVQAASVNGELFVLHAEGLQPYVALRVRHANGSWSPPEDIQTGTLANVVPAAIAAL
jgi:hypothetical protein